MTTKTIYISKDHQEFETENECLSHEEVVDQVLLVLASVRMFDQDMMPVEVKLEHCNENCDIVERFRNQFESVYYFALYGSSDVTRDTQWQLFRLHGNGVSRAIGQNDIRIDNYHDGDIIAYDDTRDTFFNLTNRYCDYGEIMRTFCEALNKEHYR